MLDVRDDLGHYKNLLSMLSSIKLQLNAFQAVTQPASNWLHGIWSLLSAFHCELDVVTTEQTELSQGRWSEKHCVSFTKRGVFNEELDAECLRFDRFDCDQQLRAKQKINEKRNGIIDGTEKWIPKKKRNNNSKQKRQSQKEMKKMNDGSADGGKLNEDKESGFCTEILSKKQYFVGFQHKTGHIIGQHLFRYLAQFCGINEFVIELDNKPFLVSKLLKAQDAATLNQTMIYHFTRDPLNTIISGYNYWKNGKEGWVTRSGISNIHQDHRFLAFNFTVNQTIDSTTRRPFECFLDRYFLESDFPFVGTRNLVNDTEFGIEYAVKENFSISRWYQYLEREHGAMGLYEEFKRYFNCEFNDKYAVYQLIRKYHGENNALHTFWNDDVRDNFEENVSRFLNSVGMKEEDQRSRFMELCRPLAGNRKHSAGHFDERDEQKKELLSLDPFICQTLRKMTELISAPWNYTDLC